MTKWLKRKETGWKKTQSATTRRRKLLDSTDKRLTMRDRYIEAARRVQKLSNITKDNATRRTSRSDSSYFFQRARGVK